MGKEIRMGRFSRRVCEALVDVILADGAAAQQLVVAVDGGGGAGKSTLAAQIGPMFGAQVLHTDDFASPEHPLDWWPATRTVLEKWCAREPVSFRPWDWGHDARSRNEVAVDPARPLLLEGVSASRDAFARCLGFRIWVDTPRDVRLARGLERDGHHLCTEWERGMMIEDEYIAREKPRERADVVVDGMRGGRLMRR